MKILAYYKLTKPGIVRGNAITAAGGFLLAAHGHPKLVPFLAMLVGLSLIIASGCVWNNYIDRNIDKKMKRTKDRALVTGNISVVAALTYGTVLGIIGTFLLFRYTNTLTTFTALFGFIAYVIIYGIGKRVSVHGTAVGSISGSIPPVVGYVAVTNQLDLGALLLFIVLVCWQMPHFYAIAIFRMKDYAKAGIPVLPLKKGIYATKVAMVLYIIAFIMASLSLTVFGITGLTYAVIMGLVGLWWLDRSIRGFDTMSNDTWARKVFGVSLVALLVFSVMISLDSFLP